MHTIKRSTLFLVVFAGLLPHLSWGQLELSAFTATGRGGVATTFATDYQALGINPANLGRLSSFRDPLITVGFGEGSLTFAAEAIPRKEMFDAIREGISGNRLAGDDRLTFADKIRAAERLTATDITVNGSFMPIGIGVHLPGGKHGLAFSIRNRFQFFANMNSNLADLIFMGVNSKYFERLLLSNGQVSQNPRNPKYEGTIDPFTEAEYEQVIFAGLDTGSVGQDLGEFLAGSRVTFSYTNEYNLGYGARIVDTYNFSLYAGLDISYIRGVMLLNLDVGPDQTINENAFSLASTFVTQSDTSLVLNSNIALRDALFPEGVSSGVGYTLGLSAVIKQDLYLGISISNWSKLLPGVGKIRLSDNAYAIDPTTRLERFSGYGLDSYNLFVFDARSFNIAGTGDSGPFEWDRVELPEQELPANVRMGVSYNYLNTIHVGADVIIPLNQAFGNPSGTLLAVGGDFRLSRLLRVSSGINTVIRSSEARSRSQGNSRINMPLGITYTTRKGNYEAGIATRDIFTYLFNSDGSTVSFASGFLRFKIGAVKMD